MYSKDQSDQAIVVKNISKYYRTYDKPIDRLKQSIFPNRQYFREFWALKDVSLNIQHGSSLGIIGRNGSGKSTLLQLICNTLTPTNGYIEVHGRIGALLELGSGFNSEFSGLDNVYLNASILGLSRTQIEQRLDSILGFADIGNYVKEPIKTYSSGMIVRLAFAVVAHIDAEILIIDEALSVGDIFFTQKCSRFLKSFREKGTLLFVSHDMEAVKALCDQSAWLDKGKLKLLAPTKVVADAYFAQAYGTPDNQAIEKLNNTTQPSPDSSGDNIASEYKPAPRSQPWFDERQLSLGDNKFGALLEVSTFHQAIQNSERFGTSEEVEILDVQLIDPISGSVLKAFKGGYPYCLHIICRCKKELEQPDIGFCLNDKTGQILFGDNTSLLRNRTRWLNGNTYKIIFEFDFPLLKVGEYTITVAIQEHREGHPKILTWIHDALLVYTLASSVGIGLSGIPMRKIHIICEQNEANHAFDELNISTNHLEKMTVDYEDPYQLTAHAQRSRRGVDFRVRMTTSCMDSRLIPKVEEAGCCYYNETTQERVQIMHNGLKVLEGGYYGQWMTDLIKELKGHHEPQEELVFHHLLKRLGTDSSMIELGSFWSYYSLWFLYDGIRNGGSNRRAVCLEADPKHLEIGKRNAALNQLQPTFVLGFAAAKASQGEIPFDTETSGSIVLRAWSVPKLMEEHGLETLDVLHVDTQGAELEVLEGSKHLIEAGKIRFVVLSTHSYEICGDPLLHQRCLKWLQNHGAHIICEHDVHESFSGDGLIVASFKAEDKDWLQPLSLNRYCNSLFANPAYYVPMRPRTAPLH